LPNVAKAIGLGVFVLTAVGGGVRSEVGTAAAVGGADAAGVAVGAAVGVAVGGTAV
jgi:hypothetical protein